MTFLLCKSQLRVVRPFNLNIFGSTSIWKHLFSSKLILMNKVLHFLEF